MKRNLTNSYSLNNIFMVIILISLSSCYQIGNDDDTFNFVGVNNTYKGIVVDENGNPLTERTVVIESSTELIAEVETNINGIYEVNGNIFNRNATVGLVNSENNVFVDSEYTLTYTYDPNNQNINIPPLITIPSSTIRIEVFNNNDLDYTVNIDYVIGLCQKYFEDDVELNSLCYESDNRSRSYDGFRNGPAIINLRVVTGTEITIEVNNSVNSIIETIVVDQINQEETIILN